MFIGCASVGAGVGAGLDTVTSAISSTPPFSAVIVVFPAVSAMKSPVSSIAPTFSLLLVHSRSASGIS